MNWTACKSNQVKVTILLFIALSAQAQTEIPIGSWRLHTSFNNIVRVVLDGGDKVYAAAKNGVLILDRQDNSFSTISKLDGLNGAAISGLSYDVLTRQLLVAYTDGKFDVINSSNEVRRFDPTKNISLVGSKRINFIQVEDALVYFSTDFGVIVFDLHSLQVKETWRDLGPTGGTLQINASSWKGDSIFLATAKGIMAGDRKSNLLDFNNWKRYSTGELNAPVQSISTFNDHVYAAVNSAGIYRREGGSWIKESYLQGSSFQSLDASSTQLLISEAGKLWSLSLTNTLSAINSTEIVAPHMAIADNGGKLWIADGVNGLVSNTSGSFIKTIPNGPSSDEMINLIAARQTVYAVAGGYAASGTALQHPGTVDMFSAGSWSTRRLPVQDVTDFALSENGTQYASTFGFGVAVQDAQGSTSILNDTNSPLENTNPPANTVNMTGLAIGGAGLWMTNYGATQPLHVMTGDRVWESFSFPFASARYPLKVIVDFNATVWMSLDPNKGGGITAFNKSTNTSTYLTDLIGSGGLPSKSVNAMAVDRDGFVWIGTDVGVAYFMETSAIFSGSVNAVKPIFDSHFLLREDRVTALAVDGGNRKWMGTERGAWLFNPTGEQLIYNFTSENSPLPSNNILDIAINGETGEVFFATSVGVASYRAGSTVNDGAFNNVKVFPNPVTSNFVGIVGISGLATDAIVKITDITGRLVWQTRANGGTATWDVLDENGRRVPTGVYVVFTVSEDGAEHVATKIAVVD